MIPDGTTIMVGGFMGCGIPLRLIDEMVRQGKSALTLICNDTARPSFAVGKLIDAGLVARVITSHIGTNPETQRRMIEGSLVVDLVPQGTLAERIRAGGFGLGGILTPTGVGTVVVEEKQKIDVDGNIFLLETALRADFALINAKREPQFLKVGNTRVFGSEPVFKLHPCLRIIATSYWIDIKHLAIVSLVELNG
jgi:acetate CoA/acetoacetate CoA-transferase alpha subunit